MRSFLELAKERYSVRAYQNRAVEEEKIAKILEAARVAPTACNNQPQKIYVVRSEEGRRKLSALTPCTFDAPVVFVVGYEESRSAKGMISAGHDFGDTDAAIVCTHMMLEACELGLGSCYVGYFREKDVAAALQIPESVHLRSLLPVGYAAGNAVASAMHTQYRPDGDMVEER